MEGSERLRRGGDGGLLPEPTTKTGKLPLFRRMMEPSIQQYSHWLIIKDTERLIFSWWPSTGLGTITTHQVIRCWRDIFRYRMVENTGSWKFAIVDLANWWDTFWRQSLIQTRGNIKIQKLRFLQRKAFMAHMKCGQQDKGFFVKNLKENSQLC